MYYYAGKDAKTGAPVYIRCIILEDYEDCVKAKSVKTGREFYDSHQYFFASI